MARTWLFVVAFIFFLFKSYANRDLYFIHSFERVKPLLLVLKRFSKETTVNIFSDEFDKISPLMWKQFYLDLGQIQISKETINRNSKLNLLLVNKFLLFKNAMIKYKFWQPSLFYVLITNTSSSENILHHLWHKYSMYNVFIVARENIEVYNPSTKTIINLKNFDSKQISEFLKHRLLNWHLGKIYAVTFERESSLKITSKGVSGYEGKIFSSIVQYLNLSKILLLNTTDKSRYGYKFSNGTLTGTFKYLVAKTANLSAIGHFIKWYDVPELAFSHYISSENLCIFVAKSGKVPHIMAFIKSLNLLGTIYLILLYVVADLIFILLHYIENKFNKTKKIYVRPFFMVYRILLGIPIPINYIASKLYEMLILSSMFLMSFVIINFFQSALMTFSSAPLYLKNINTIDELRSRSTEIWLSSPEISTSLMNDESLDLNFKLKTEIEIIEANHREDMAKTLRLNVLLSPRIWEYNGVKATNPRHIVNECLGTYFVALVIPVGSPFQTSVNNVIARLIESGITNKWTIEGANRNESGVQLISTKSKLEVKSLSIKDIMISLILLFCGIMFSLLSFTVELFIKSRWNN